MIYKEISLTSGSQNDLRTELLFNIASERASGVQLLRLQIDTEENRDKMFSCLMRMLRSLKSSGAVQLYANGVSFESGSREAEYLINKYSDIIGDGENISIPQFCAYVRL